MQAYATAERLTLSGQLRSSSPAAAPSLCAEAPNAATGALIDELLARLAELVVDRLMERVALAGTNGSTTGWMPGVRQRISASTATHFASSRLNERFPCTRTGRVASSTSTAQNSASGAELVADRRTG